MSDGEFKPKVVVEGGWGLPAKVTVLATAADQKRKQVVDKLREILAEAENGNLLDVMIVAYRADGRHTFYTTPIDASDAARQIGGLRIMTGKLVDAVKLEKPPNK